jgi:hypothetical protein
MEVWVYDRSGPYAPTRFDIHDEPAGYTMMDEEELGLDTCMKRDVDDHFVNIERDDTGKLTKICLEPNPITRQRAIVCCGTSCFVTKTPGFKDHDCVTKFSWTSARRRPEADLLKLAQQRIVKGVANLVGHLRITIIEEMRSGLTFGTPYF